MISLMLTLPCMMCAQFVVDKCLLVDFPETSCRIEPSKTLNSSLILTNVVTFIM